MNNKLTLIKIGEDDYRPSPQDLEKWRDIFEKAMVEEIDLKEDADYITLVKIGSGDYKPTKEDLEAWKQIFEEAQKDSNFKVFYSVWNSS